MGNNRPPRTAPVRNQVPPTAESSTTVCRRFLRTGDRSSMPRNLPQPDNGEVHVFYSQEALVSYFNTIPEEARGSLYNEDPDAFRGQIRREGEDGPLQPLAAIARGIGNIPVAEPHFIYLVEQYEWGRTVMMGIGMARRAHTSTPPSITPEGHVAAAGAHAHARGNAVGLALDYLNSIGQAFEERVHHLVVIYQPPATLGGSWDVLREDPYHVVMFRSMGPHRRVSSIWQVAPPHTARVYLRLR